MNEYTYQISKVGLLATGEELVTGDVINSNGPYIARKLFEYGFQLGMHLTVGDKEDDITAAIHYLLSNHDILLITGGLGPTSDDRTRFALSRAIAKPLIFNEIAWLDIEKRLNKSKLVIHQSNRQQALFPEDASILPNPKGTAAGCFLQSDNKFIFMLPGPPNECLTMFDKEVLPKLLASGKNQDQPQLKWRLFGVSEGEIADKLDKLVSIYNCITGYRWDYPYLEFKIRGFLPQKHNELVSIVNEAINTYVICTPEYSASQLLIHQLENFPYSILIQDQLTQGLLQHTLITSTTKDILQFNPTITKQALLKITINGKNILWKEDDSDESQIEIIFSLISDVSTQHNEIIHSSLHAIPYRQRNMVHYAVEYICHKILTFLQTYKMP